MAGKFSVYSANQVLNKVMRSTDWTPATSYWVALFVGAGTSETALRANTVGSAQEVPNSNAYARIEVRGITAITFPASTAGVTQNSSAIAWASATGSWGTVSHVALMDSATIGAGNVILYGALAVAKAVDTGDTMRVNAGALSLNL